MAVLDLQAMERVAEKGKGNAPAGSRTSKGCNNTTIESTLSLVLCNIIPL